MIVKLHDGTEGELDSVVAPTSLEAATALARLLTGVYGVAPRPTRDVAMQSAPPRGGRTNQHSWESSINPRVSGVCRKCGMVRRVQDRPGKENYNPRYPWRRIQLVYEAKTGEQTVTSANGKVPPCVGQT